MRKLLTLSFFLFCFVVTNPIGAMAGNRAVFLTPNEDDKLIPGVNFAIIANPSAYDIPLYALQVRYDDGYSDWSISYTPIHFRQVVAIPFNLEPGHGAPALLFVYQNAFYGDDVISQEFGIVSSDENYSQLFENPSDQFPVKTIISVIRPRKPIYANS